jgi:hypothetical protein
LRRRGDARRTTNGHGKDYAQQTRSVKTLPVIQGGLQAGSQ